MVSRSRVRLACAALACLFLGSMFTWTMGPAEHDAEGVDGDAYDPASGGVLHDPSGFGLAEDDTQMPGVIANAGYDSADFAELEEQSADGRPPSVTGALSELHHAVSDKLQSWNPYHRPETQGLKGSKVNSTLGAKGKGRPSDTKSGALSGEYVKEGISEEERLGARIRVGKCTILFNGNSFWERAIKTHERHDKLHGYRLHVLRQSIMDDVWSKPAYILSLLLRELAKPESERLEWLFWVDADTIILNPHIPIETFLPPPGSDFEDVHLMYSNDWNGLNNGVFPVRVNQWSVQLFSAITSYRHYRPDDQLIFRDQSAMNTLMQEPAFATHLVQAPQRWFNAYQGEHNETLAPYQIRRGDLLVHFAGVPDRERRMGYWLDRAEQHLDDWEIPVRSTSYPQEAKDFWIDQAGARQNQKSSLAELRLKVTDMLTKTDQQLNDYGDRVSDGEKESINSQREQLKNYVDAQDWQAHIPKLEEAIQKLSEVSAPLVKAVTDANKVLLTSAHEAIFAGEKDLLEGGYGSGVTNPELQSISEAVKSLKHLVMSPEEFWNKNDITAATNNVNLARAMLHETTAALFSKVKALEEAKQAAAQASPDHAAGGATEQDLSASRTIPDMSNTAVAVGAPMYGEGGLEIAHQTATSIALQTVTGDVVTVTPAAAMVWMTATVVQGSESMPTPEIVDR